MGARGRPPNLKRHKQARDLRNQGLTLEQIAKRLGITRQAAHYLLGHDAGPRPIFCRKCNAVVVKGHPAMDNIKKRPLCLACLAKAPHATFGERLRSLRLARGLTQEQLTKACGGVSVVTIRAHEREITDNPTWETLLTLVRFLGPKLVGLEG